MQSKSHWEEVYSHKADTAMSWFQPHAETSLRLVEQLVLAPVDPIIDVGGGASHLVDELLLRSYEDVSVLDISATALAIARKRLGEDAKRVHWLAGDILQVELPPQHFALWHDRAVFHFLTGQQDRQRYVQRLLQALRPDGRAIIATFADDGPTQCSGLPVMRYNADQLAAELGPQFHLLQHERQTHITPAGKEQRFLFAVFQRLE